jgi:hypothetical protein
MEREREKAYTERREKGNSQVLERRRGRYASRKGFRGGGAAAGVGRRGREKPCGWRREGGGGLQRWPWGRWRTARR